MDYLHDFPTKLTHAFFFSRMHATCNENLIPINSVTLLWVNGIERTHHTQTAHPLSTDDRRAHTYTAHTSLKINQLKTSNH
jgi:hypothetical protein